jgi:hypothetical protein
LLNDKSARQTLAALLAATTRSQSTHFNLSKNSIPPGFVLKISGIFWNSRLSGSGIRKGGACSKAFTFDQEKAFQKIFPIFELKNSNLLRIWKMEGFESKT